MATEKEFMRLTPEIRSAGSTLASHRNKQMWAKVSAKERSDRMRDLRMKAIEKHAAKTKAKRPGSSPAWQLAQGVFLAQNAENRNKE